MIDTVVMDKVHMEDGDILMITVPVNTPMKMLSHFRERTLEIIRRKFGDKCMVIVWAAEPGEVTMSIAKRNELSDMKQQIDDLTKQGTALQKRFSSSW